MWQRQYNLHSKAIFEKIRKQNVSSITKQYLSEYPSPHKYSFTTTSILTRTYLHVQYNTTYYELWRANYSGNTEEENNGYVVFK